MEEQEAYIASSDEAEVELKAYFVTAASCQRGKTHWGDIVFAGSPGRRK